MVHVSLYPGCDRTPVLAALAGKTAVETGFADETLLAIGLERQRGGSEIRIILAAPLSCWFPNQSPHWINKLPASYDCEVRKRGCSTMMRASESG
jgi:hypothetical protein